LNIFSRLEKYRNQQEENFFTEAFVGVFECNKALLCSLMGKIAQVSISQSEVRIDSQIRERAGQREEQYDVRITDRSINSTIIIENKIGSPKSDDQLKSYYAQLDKPGENNYLILITRRYEEEWKPPEGRVTFIQKRWFEIHKIVADANNHHDSLIINFLHFMKEKGMVIEKVDSALFKGTRALYNLLQQMDIAAKEAGVERCKNQKGGLKEDSSGLWFEHNKHRFWLGINYTISDTLIVYSEDSAVIQNLANRVGGRDDGPKEVKIVDLGGKFFEKNLNEQQNWFMDLFKKIRDHLS
jgi:hypothetical protein